MNPVLTLILVIGSIITLGLLIRFITFRIIEIREDKEHEEKMKKLKERRREAEFELLKRICKRLDNLENKIL